MESLISIDELIEQAKNQGIDFGKGDPYNRLRYYTKIGWLPHMIRQRDAKGNITGHYEKDALSKLVMIEKLKGQGLENEGIAVKIAKTSTLKNLMTLISAKEFRMQLVSVLTLTLITVILANELGIIRIGKSKSLTPLFQETALPSTIIANGVSFIPKNQKTIFVKTTNISSSSQVYVTFTQNYDPAVRFWVANISNSEGFTLELDTPTFSGASFSWWVTK